MDSNDLSQVNTSTKAVDDNLEGFGFATKKLVKKLKGMGRAGQKYVDALTDMTAVTKWGQEALKEYWDMKNDRPKTNADYKKAKTLLEKGIKAVDKTLADFPTTSSALFPIKRKLLIQLTDVEHLTKNEIKTPEELDAEVKERYKL